MSWIDNTASISAARHSRGITVTASVDSLDFFASTAKQSFCLH